MAVFLPAAEGEASEPVEAVVPSAFLEVESAVSFVVEEVDSEDLSVAVAFLISSGETARAFGAVVLGFGLLADAVLELELPLFLVVVVFLDDDDLEDLAEAATPGTAGARQSAVQTARMSDGVFLMRSFETLSQLEKFKSSQEMQCFVTFHGCQSK